MRFVAVIHDDNGKILSQQKNATELTVAGKQYIKHEIQGRLEDYYVSNGQVLPKGDCPALGHIFNYATGAWDLDLDLAKSLVWDEIKNERNAEEFSEFVCEGNTFQCDQASQMRINSAAQAALLDDSISMVWTLADNTTQTFNATELKQIGKALSDHVKECHDRGRILRAQIDAATTQEELEAIVW